MPKFIRIPAGASESYLLPIEVLQYMDEVEMTQIEPDNRHRFSKKPVRFEIIDADSVLDEISSVSLTSHYVDKVNGAKS